MDDSKPGLYSIVTGMILPFWQIMSKHPDDGFEKDSWFKVFSFFQSCASHHDSWI